MSVRKKARTRRRRNFYSPSAIDSQSVIRSGNALERVSFDRIVPVPTIVHSQIAHLDTNSEASDFNFPIREEMEDSPEQPVEREDRKCKHLSSTFTDAGRLLCQQSYEKGAEIKVAKRTTIYRQLSDSPLVV